MSKDNPTPPPGKPATNAFSLKTYRVASRIMGPFVSMALKQRLKEGKEDPARLDERRGLASRPRPDGPLVWIHGASVGESLSILPLVKRLGADHHDYHFLVTTGTVTSAELMTGRLPPKAIHQYAPIDHPAFVTRFLDHWRPDACLFVESELWPNLIHLTRARSIPMALVNGRISPKSYASWKSRQNAARELLSAFDVIMAQDTQNEQRLAELHGGDVRMFGNLKMTAAPLPATEEALAELKAQLDGHAIWLAASTHPGEEEIVLSAHERAAARFDRLLTIIAPRHPNRGAEIAATCKAKGLKAVRRSQGQRIADDTEIYIADTLGELGLFYRLSDIAFVGGSITEIGGHNPLEPALLKCAILYGPHIFNFADTYRDMRASGGTALVRNERDLSAAIVRLLMDTMTREAMAENAESWAVSNAEEVLSDIVGALEPILPGAVRAPTGVETK
ncbi:3-deoxy-D-manno-octulosonic acid transferase [Aquisalinus flavus]|uniref:3-deoxy-D-manno-octulosonic acid transferase n=1 Tax=Aquisalinus flavus TaxID=1526572 RepID=A0A8J2Y741_9PROT|nr:3-deoxy-D-manno-octulosonic acid transferase [Aquisalinus flavus]MBD0428138.1 3-deoxy-D-manno-octulosonic acid transferase [Aquisalinus flavus]GGD18407.1 3-deoxy-D-manno-octulosonic acid transferase [Aquisalinus flavus]